jgi:hypothetical protein
LGSVGLHLGIELRRLVGKHRFARSKVLRIINPMSAQEVIAEFKELPPAERAQVAKYVVENDD